MLMRQPRDGVSLAILKSYTGDSTTVVTFSHLKNEA